MVSRLSAENGRKQTITSREGGSARPQKRTTKAGMSCAFSNIRLWRPSYDPEGQVAPVPHAGPASVEFKWSCRLEAGATSPPAAC